MKFVLKNCELDWAKPTKQKIYREITIIFIYKLDKLKDTLNTTTMHLL